MIMMLLCSYDLAAYYEPTTPHDVFDDGFIDKDGNIK